MLTAVTAAMTNDPNFDLNGDTFVNDDDISAWLIEGGANNPNQPLTGGNPFLRGDANLDGIVDGQDFIEWNANKFTNNTAWCDGNFWPGSVCFAHSGLASPHPSLPGAALRPPLADFALPQAYMWLPLRG